MEDLWKHVLSAGTELVDSTDTDEVLQYDWDFSNLERAFEEGGPLHNTKVYLFGHTETKKYSQGDQKIKQSVPVVIAVVSPFPPSDKTVPVGYKEVIVPMKQVRMDWVPYIPPEQRNSQIERLEEPKIFVLTCMRRRAALKRSNLPRRNLYYPYLYPPIRPHAFDKLSPIVPFVFQSGPSRPTIAFLFPWEGGHNLEEVADLIISRSKLNADEKVPLMESLKYETYETNKIKNKEMEARKKALEAMSDETRAAYENMRVYKFYPTPGPNTPDISMFTVKSPNINKYYMDAHQVL